MLKKYTWISDTGGRVDFKGEEMMLVHSHGAVKETLVIPSTVSIYGLENLTKS